MIKTANLTGPVSRNAGGLYESVRRLTQSLQAGGMAVSVFGTEDENTAADIGAWAPVRVQAFRPLWPKKFGYSPKFLEALEEFRPDLTHTHGVWLYASVATNHYSRRRRAPYIISAHGMLDRWALHNSRWKKLLAYFLFEETHLREASCLRALCDSEARAMREVGLKNPIAVIPNGIDVPAVQGGMPAPWRDWVPAGQKVLLFLSRIHPKKGLVNLVRAWSQLDKGRSNGWVLAIAGWDQGGHEGQLKKLATELQVSWMEVGKAPMVGGREGMRSGVSLLFLGPQFDEAKRACYLNCDGFVLPSFSEGVPMVVLEAWAYGKAVVMTPECNLPQGFTRDAAIRIETGVEGIVRGLNEFFEGSDFQRGSWGANGLKLVTEQFAWPVVARQMARTYEWMLGSGEKPVEII